MLISAPFKFVHVVLLDAEAETVERGFFHVGRRLVLDELLEVLRLCFFERMLLFTPWVGYAHLCFDLV